MSLPTRVLLFALACGQVLLAAWLFAIGFEESAAQAPLVTEPNPAVPAGYAFAIWGPIFGGCLLLTLRDLLDRTTAWMVPSPAFMGAGYALSCLWMLVARFGPLWLTVPLIWAMLIALSAAFIPAARMPDRMGSPVRRGLALGTLGVYVGWLTAAAFVNTADVLPGYGFNRFGLTVEQFGILSLLGCALVAGWVTVQSRGSLPYVAAVAWALVAVVVQNGAPSLSHPVSMTATGLVVALLGVMGWIRARATRYSCACESQY